MPLNLSPVDPATRTASILGAKTVTATAAREAAMAKFNAPPQDLGVVSAPALTSGQSPSEPGAVLDPSSALSQTPISDVADLATPEDAAGIPDPKEAEIASHYANLARKEKVLRIREARINQKMQAMNAPSAPAATQTPAFDASKYVNRDDLINNPFGVLNDLGLTYEQLTQKALDAPSAEDMQQRREIALLKAELATFKESQQKIEKTFSDNQTLARQQAELQIRQDVNRVIAQDPTFEVTRAHGAQRDVVKLITSVYDNGMGPEYPRGTILDATEAALMVENELTERAYKFAQLKKIQSRLNLDQTANKQPQTTQQPQTSTLRTLTNAVGTSARKLSPRDRALAAFRGEVIS